MIRKNSNNSPLILKYERELQENPSSKVFAPLAEAYRKLGMIQEAVKVLRQGIKRHPSYVLGYLSLAACFYDQKNFEESYRILRPFVAGNLENIRLQRLFADSCYQLALFEEALETYKYILFLNSRDKEVAELVSELEEKFEKVTQEKMLPEKASTLGEEDFWVQRDFIIPSTLQVETDWELHKPAEIEVSPIEQVDSSKKEVVLSKEENSKQEAAENEELFTHTLVDLYCQQNLPEKAIEVLEKISQLMPHDQKSKARLASLKAQVTEKSKNQSDSERLLEVFDKRVNKKSLQVRELENKFQSFLGLTKSRAEKYKQAERS